MAPVGGGGARLGFEPRVIGHNVWVGGQLQARRTDVLSSGMASLALGAPSAGQVDAWAPLLRRLTR